MTTQLLVLALGQFTGYVVAVVLIRFFMSRWLDREEMKLKEGGR